MLQGRGMNGLVLAKRASQPAVCAVGGRRGGCGCMIVIRAGQSILCMAVFPKLSFPWKICTCIQISCLLWKLVMYLQSSPFLQKSLFQGPCVCLVHIPAAAAQKNLVSRCLWKNLHLRLSKAVCLNRQCWPRFCSCNVECLKAGVPVVRVFFCDMSSSAATCRRLRKCWSSSKNQKLPKNSRESFQFSFFLFAHRTGRHLSVKRSFIPVLFVEVEWNIFLHGKHVLYVPK